MRELREAIKKRLESRRRQAQSAGDYRDWDGATEAHAAISELEWVLRQFETAEGAVEIDPTRLFKESVRFEQDVTFDGNVYVVGNMTVNGKLTSVGFNVE
jgi:hypothetical protein